MSRLSPLLLLLLLSACATVIKGGSQEVRVASQPPAATCTFARNGSQMATVPVTPGSVTLPRGSTDLLVTCTKPGFEAGSQTVRASFNGVTFGNLLLGGIVGVIVDASTGANFSYPDVVAVDLDPLPPAAALPPGERIRLQPNQPGA